MVHRLDRDASGCLVIARTADSAAWLSHAFAQHATAASNPGAVYQGTTAGSAVVLLSTHAVLFSYSGLSSRAEIVVYSNLLAVLCL